MADALRIHRQPSMERGRMVLAFTGWMDGGDVSTGTVEQLAARLKSEQIAEIASDTFYVYNVPGSMEIASLFRPHTTISNGLIIEYTQPQNRFYATDDANVVLFEGKEPNINWKSYADAVFDMARASNVSTVLFAGSVAGTVPHTRPPRFHGSVSNPDLKPWLEEHGIAFSDYAGPASFVTYLLVEAQRCGIDMAALVAEIPAYVQGRNAKVIEATTRKVASMLELEVDLDSLHREAEEFEQRLDAIVRDRDDLSALIHRIEHEYDRETLNSQEDELKEWFESQDIWLD